MFEKNHVSTWLRPGPCGLLLFFFHCGLRTGASGCLRCSRWCWAACAGALLGTRAPADARCCCAGAVRRPACAATAAWAPASASAARLPGPLNFGKILGSGSSTLARDLLPFIAPRLAVSSSREAERILGWRRAGSVESETLALRSARLSGGVDSAESDTFAHAPKQVLGLACALESRRACHHAAECYACGGWLAEMGTRRAGGAEDFGDLLARSCFGFRLPHRLFIGPA